MSGRPVLAPPEAVLPHRPPFLFLSEVTELVPGDLVRGRWVPDPDAWFFSGHFPGRPTLPGVLIVEALGQLGAYAVLADGSRAGKLPLFGGADGARFRRQVLPGEGLELEVSVGRMSARAGRGTGRAHVGEELACEVDLLFVFVDADAP